MKQLSTQGWKELEQFEGLELEAYQDFIGKWTIGIGTTYYPGGKPVKQGDTCTESEARLYVQSFLNDEEAKIYSSTDVAVTQNEWDAMVILAYNIGPGGFSNSHLQATINEDPSLVNKKNIIHCWKMWDQAGGRLNLDLLSRRNKELFIYFGGQVSLEEIKATN